MVSVRQIMWWWGKNVFHILSVKGRFCLLCTSLTFLILSISIFEPSHPQLQTRKRACIQAQNGGSEAECFTQKEETRDCNTQCCKWRCQTCALFSAKHLSVADEICKVVYDTFSVVVEC